MMLATKGVHWDHPRLLDLDMHTQAIVLLQIMIELDLPSEAPYEPAIMVPCESTDTPEWTAAFCKVFGGQETMIAGKGGTGEDIDPDDDQEEELTMNTEEVVCEMNKIDWDEPDSKRYILLKGRYVWVLAKSQIPRLW